MTYDSDQFQIHGRLNEICRRLDALEANSRNAASSDQPIVGPPSQSEDSRALARPEILAEVKTFVADLVDLYSKMDGMVSVAVERSYFKKILQHLDDLDQGPDAQKPAPRGMAEPPYKSTSLGS